MIIALREKYPNTEFFLVCIFPPPYSVEMWENTDQIKAPYLNTFHAVFTQKILAE